MCSAFGACVVFYYGFRGLGLAGVDCCSVVALCVGWVVGCAGEFTVAMCLLVVVLFAWCVWLCAGGRAHVCCVFVCVLCVCVGARVCVRLCLGGIVVRVNRVCVVVGGTVWRVQQRGACAVHSVHCVV